MARSFNEEMKFPNLKMAVFENAEELARGAAEEWVARLLAAPKDKVTAALPGGRIYRLFFSALAEEAQKHPGVLNNVHFFWGDERCVPPVDDESNFRLAEDLLFRPLNVPSSQVHRIYGEKDPVEAARLAEAELKGQAEITESGQPRLDYVFLGMGEDGHVASLFPGEVIEIAKSNEVYRPVKGPKPPKRRITLGYPAIAAATSVWVLVSGSGKASALRQSISPGGKTPLGRVLSSRSDTLILTDIRLEP